MSLVLMKKLRQSQLLSEQAAAAVASAKLSISQQSQQQQPKKAGANTPSATTTPSSKNVFTAPSSGLKNVLTPDFSHLTPVSVVSANRFVVCTFNN